MPTKILKQLLRQLDDLKTQFDEKSASRIEDVLRRLRGTRVDDTDSLVLLHELLLFVRAYPHNLRVLRLCDSALRQTPSRVSQLEAIEVDLSPLRHPEVSGIAGTSVIDTFGFHLVRWLDQLEPSQIDFYWDWFEDENRIAEAWLRFLPLFAEDALVEANVPYRRWLQEARGNNREVHWVISRFNRLGLDEASKAEVYNAQKLYVRWRFLYANSRTGQRSSFKSYYFHNSPLIQRREVKFEEELRKRAPRLERLSLEKGREAIDRARVASTIRYRELYGFTHGDPGRVHLVGIGRGVELEVITLPPEKRLPLRAYHAAMIYKNGVPVGYFEALSLFERMEGGFNLYYTFREGETAWLYARVLNIMRRLTGVSSFVLDPYQIGFENEEGIKSGAFWFYRKLGFRSTRPDIENLARREEEKINSKRNYRTSATTLRRLAKAPMIFELDKNRRGDWDRFQIRKLGFAVQRMMCERFNGDAERMRAHAAKVLRDILGTEDASDLAVSLLLIPELRIWTSEEKELLSRIVEAKFSTDEGRYLRLMQQHERLRKSFIELGS